MCIEVYLRPKRSLEILIQGLKRLEYRGYVPASCMRRSLNVHKALARCPISSRPLASPDAPKALSRHSPHPLDHTRRSPTTSTPIPTCRRAGDSTRAVTAPSRNYSVQKAHSPTWLLVQEPDDRISCSHDYITHIIVPPVEPKCEALRHLWSKEIVPWLSSRKASHHTAWWPARASALQSSARRDIHRL